MIPLLRCYLLVWIHCIPDLAIIADVRLHGSASLRLHMFRLILHCYSLSLQGHNTQEYHCLRRLSQDPRPQSLIYLYDARRRPQNWYGAHMQRKTRDQAAGTFDSTLRPPFRPGQGGRRLFYAYTEGFFFLPAASQEQVSSAKQMICRYGMARKCRGGKSCTTYSI